MTSDEGSSLPMSKVILVADDSATMQTVAEITFKATEFTYVGAHSADEAIEKARAQKPVLVLADAVMQGKSGYDLCRSLKTDGKLGDIPVVILCGNSAAFDAAKGTAVGADGTLSKPWDTQVMLDKVTEFIAKAAGGVARPGAAAATPAAAVAQPMAAAASSRPNVAPVKPSPVSPAAVAAKPDSKVVPPRSATIMGMPTVKLPGAATPEPAPPAMEMKAPAKPVAAAPAAAVAAPTPSMEAPMSPAPAMPPAPGDGQPAGVAAVSRPPMVSAVPTKRSALVERTLEKMAARLAAAAGIEPGSPELLGLLKLSTEVVERIVWEVVPELAEQIIRENLQELTARRGN